MTIEFDNVDDVCVFLVTISIFSSVNFQSVRLFLCVHKYLLSKTISLKPDSIWNNCVTTVVTCGMEFSGIQIISLFVFVHKIKYHKDRVSILFWVFFLYILFYLGIFRLFVLFCQLDTNTIVSLSLLGF